MEVILLAGINVAAWNLALQRHHKLNDPGLVFDRKLGSRRYHPLGVNDLTNPETRKLNPSYRPGRDVQMAYARGRSHRWNAAVNPRIDPKRRDTEHSLHTYRRQRLNAVNDWITFGDPRKGGNGRALMGRTKTVTQMSPQTKY